MKFERGEADANGSLLWGLILQFGSWGCRLLRNRDESCLYLSNALVRDLRRDT